MFNQGHQQRLTDDACMIYARKAGLEASWPMEKKHKIQRRKYGSNHQLCKKEKKC